MVSEKNAKCVDVRFFFICPIFDLYGIGARILVDFVYQVWRDIDLAKLITNNNVFVVLPQNSSDLIKLEK